MFPTYDNVVGLRSTPFSNLPKHHIGWLHYPAIFPLNTQRISRYPHCRPQCMAESRINRNKELKHNKPHLVVQLESLVGMIMEITTISWDMTLKIWLYTESTTGTGTFQVIPYNEATLHPGFHFRLALLVRLGMRFLAEKLMFSRTVSLDEKTSRTGIHHNLWIFLGRFRKGNERDNG